MWRKIKRLRGTERRAGESLLGLTAAGAAFIPARRASRVDPATVLKAEWFASRLT
jgi:hypothetical protein